MNWMPTATAPKDVYVLGYDAKPRRPFVMIWNVFEGCFVDASGDSEDVQPTHWLSLPPLPTNAPEGWLSLDKAPREGYCLGFDECLNRPFVMSWSSSKQDFIVLGGFGDEMPCLCMPIPPLVELTTM